MASAASSDPEVIRLKEFIKKEEARRPLLLYKTVIFTVDSFIADLAERLENPNKAFGIIGKPSPVSPDDSTFQKCKDALRAKAGGFGNSLEYRDFLVNPKLGIGKAPPQYAKLRSLIGPNTGDKDKYSNPLVEFFHRMKQIFLIFEQGGHVDCKGYKRLLNLFMGTTSEGKSKYNFKGIQTELHNILEIIKSIEEKEQVNEVIDMAFALNVLEAKKGMPSVPTASVVTPEEPAPDVTDADITSEMPDSAASAPVAPPSAPKAPLTARDRALIAGIAGQISRNPKVMSRRLTMDQIRQMAENIYRRRTGSGRKTYRKKKSQRKSRKLRRM